MNEYYKNLNLIDLISEKHKELRREVISQWNKKNGAHITNTESHLLAMLEINPLTISECARKVGVTRQAAHKCVKRLSDMRFVELAHIEGNKRDKMVSLSENGREYCMDMLNIKLKLEKQISESIGSVEVDRVKDLFRKIWL